MTEQKKSTDAVETKHPQQPEKAPRKSRNYGWVGSTLSIAIALAIGAGGLYLYYHNKQQNAALSAANLALQTQITSLTQLQSADKQATESKIEQLKQELQESGAKNQQQIEQVDSHIAELRNRVSAVTSSDVENWRLAQANFLVKMASRKIWSDQDVVTAIALLKDADNTLADMNDSSLMPARSAIKTDIDALSKIQQVDLDGIILTLNNLSNQVDNLSLVDKVEQGKPMDEDGKEVSASLSDWRQNLSRSWHSFMDNFITIKPRDGSKVALLAPNQEVYLRENIRSKLLIAAQAVPRRQLDTYKDSLESVSTWVNAYFDTSLPDTITFLDEIKTLEKQPLSIEMPEQLSSQPILADLVRKRIYQPASQPSPEAYHQPKPESETSQAETSVQEG